MDTKVEMSDSDRRFCKLLDEKVSLQREMIKLRVRIKELESHNALLRRDNRLLRHERKHGLVDHTHLEKGLVE